MKPLLALLIAAAAASPSRAGSKIDYWSQQRRGANFFNGVEREERWKATKDFGIEVVRLAPNKWLNGRPEAQRGDFLIGRPGAFKSIPPDDLKLLRKVLDDADKNGVKIVLTMLSLPGARWKQHNKGVEERAIWQDFSKQEAAIAFWRQLALALKGHPAVVGYNIRNEPSPEFVPPRFKDWYTGDYAAWYAKVRGTPADLNLFYRKAVKAIREVDAETPIILDSGFYSTAWAFKVLEPVPDDKTLYSFHMYEPYSFNSKGNKGRYKYPGKAPTGELDDAPVVDWSKEQLEKYLAPVSDWQLRHGIPANRIFAAEFGVYRTNPGASAYLKDVLKILNAKKWHWAFYSFREDTWDGMDYELGAGKANWKYWEAIEKGKPPGPEVYKANPLSELLKAALKVRPSDAR